MRPDCPSASSDTSLEMHEEKQHESKSRSRILCEGGHVTRDTTLVIYPRYIRFQMLHIIVAIGVSRV